MTDLVNLTGHPIRIQREGKGFITYPSKGKARLIASGGVLSAGSLSNGIKLVKPYSYDGIEGLPKDMKLDVIVSDKLAPKLIKQGWHGAVYAPDTNETSRISGSTPGSINGVRQLIVYQKSSLGFPNLVHK